MRRRSRVKLYSSAYLSLVLSTLILCAALFAIKTNIDAYLAHEKHPSASEQTNKEITQDRTVLGIGAEGWTAIFTGILAAFTMALAGFTYWLFSVTKSGITNQEKLTSRSVDEAAKAATATVEQVAISRRLLEARERPYIYVYGVKHIIDSGEPFNYSMIEYRVCNYGSTPAVIENAFIDVFSNEGWDHEAPRPIHDLHSLFTQPVFAPGEVRELQLEISEGLIRKNGGLQIIYQKDGSFKEYPAVEYIGPTNEILLCRILIEYRGAFSVEHATSGLWVYDHIFSRFVTAKNTKYNYNT